MTPSDIKRLLRQLGMGWNQRLGQHFLIDERVLNRQINYAGILKSDTVLEIGPGLGALTDKLIKAAGNVIAIEKDNLLYSYLKTNILSSSLQLILGDALKVEIPKFDKVVSNLPYNISSNITFKLLNYPFNIGIMMYQKEYAERMIANPCSKNYSRLSVDLYYKAKCEILEIIPKNAFFPQPDINSAIVKLTPRSKPPFKVHNEKFFFETIQALFSHKRKKIRNSIELWLTRKNTQLTTLDGLPYLDDRVDRLTPEEIGELSNRIHEMLN